MIYPWLQETWQRLVTLADRLPHALMFVGPPGVGKRDLADALAARLLCSQPAADGHACGVCGSCILRLSGNHPDLIPIVPAADAPSAENAEGEGGAGAATGKAKSSQIVIDQIRDLQQSLAVTGHQSSRRVVVVDPAEAMNTFTANALLKMLEEPPEGCVFLMVSSSPRQLLPTIRSRCQQWSFARPPEHDVERWMASVDAPPSALLAITGGMPLAAKRLAEVGTAPLLNRFVKDVGQLPSVDPLRLAAQWETWIKSREALAAGFGMVQLIDWMQRWVTDLAALRLGGRVRFFPAEASALAALAQCANVAGVVNCYNELARIRRVAQHPLNARLMLEDLLLRYTRAVTGSRP
jgi:DNA polymerase-3 subunit delta'